MDLLASEQQIAALSPPELVDLVVELSSGGNGRKPVKHGALVKLVSNALALSPNRDPFRHSLACLRSLGGGQFTPTQQNSLGHLFLTTIDQCKQAPALSDVDLAPARNEAAALVSSVFEGVFTLESRLVVRVAAAFGVKSPDLGESGRAAAGRFAKKLVAEKNFAAGMGLAQQLDLGAELGAALLLQMIDAGAAQAAVDWAKPYGKEVGGRIVRDLAARGEHKTAWQMIEKLGMQDDFPGAYIAYRKTSITKLAKKGVWDVARSLAEEDPILKEHLVEAAIIEEEFVHAVEFAERFGLDHLLTEEVISSSGLPSQTDCLTLPVPANRVFFVDDLEGLARAQTEISASDLVGFDSEWKADSVRGAVPNPVALLQLATRGGAWLIDLLTLGQTSPKALESFLSSFLHNENILKLGFAVNGDLDRISKTHPAIRGALQNCGPLLDIAGLANLRGIRTRSLSGICEVCLGKPLSKRVRMSNWEERPLSEAQTQYAALDALCLIPLFDLLTKPDFQVPERNSVGQESVAAEGGIAASEEPGTAEASFRTGTAEDSAAEEVGGDKTLGRKEPEEVGFEGLSETNGAAFIETESGLSRGLDSGPASRLYREIDSESQKGLLTGIGGGETGSLAGGSGSSATAELLASENGAPGSFRPSLASPGETPPVDAVSVGSGDGRSVGGYGRKPQKRWQSLVYFYGARIDTGRGNKRREKRKGMATERLERTDPADPGTIGVSETGALGLGESRLAEENAEDGAEPAGQKPGAGAVAGEKTKASEKAQGTGQGDRWSGLGLPERVAEALQKGGVGPPQVLVCWEGEENVGGVGSDMKGGGTCRVDADETGGDLLMDAEVEVEEAAVAATAPDASVSLVEGESGFRPESMEMDGSGNGTGTEKETGTVSGDEEEETRALEAWRAAKRAAAGKHKIVLEKTGLETGIGEENGGVGGGDPDRVTGSEGEGSSGHVAGGEEGHVATRERPAWQVRCIPVLISVLEAAGNIRPATVTSLGSGIEEDSLEISTPLVPPPKKRRLRPVVVLIGEGRIPDLQVVIKHLGMPGKLAWIADDHECLTYFGYPPALLPPTGHLKRALLAFDSKLRSQIGNAGARLVTASGKEGVTLAWEIGPLVRLTGAISRDFAVRGGLGLEGGTEESGEGKSRTEESGTEEDGEGGSGTKKSGTKESGEGESGTEESGERESGTEGSEGGESGTKESGKGESGTEGSGEGESDRNESSAKGAEEYGVNPGVASTDVGVTVAATAEREESGPQEGDQGMLSWRLEDGSRQGGDCQKSDVPLRPGMQDGGITGDGGIRNEIVLGEAKNREGGVLGEYRERSCGQLPPNQASGSEANGVVAVRVESSKGSLSDDEIAGGGEWGWRALGAEDTGAASEAGGAESASGGEGAENASAGGGAASASRQEFIEAASGGSFAETTFGRKVAKRASEERGVEAASRKGVAETAFGGGGGQSALGGGLAETPSGGGVAETASKRGVAETASVVGGGQTALGGGAKTRAAGLVGALKLDGRAVAVSFHQQDWETESAIEEVPLAPWHSPPRESEQLVSASVANEQVGCEQAGGQDNGSDLPPRTFRKRKLRPLEKSPLAGTGRFVGLGTRKELETLMKVLGGPSRGTRGMSTGLGGRASMREVRQNTPTEERSGYDPRSSFREAWAAEAERNRPFWAKLFPRAGSFARYERSGALHRPAGEANGGPPVGRFGWLTDEECHPADTSCAGMAAQCGQSSAVPPSARLACLASVLRPSLRARHVASHRRWPGCISRQTVLAVDRASKPWTLTGHARMSWAATVSLGC